MSAYLICLSHSFCPLLSVLRACPTIFPISRVNIPALHECNAPAHPICHSSVKLPKTNTLWIVDVAFSCGGVGYWENGNSSSRASYPFPVLRVGYGEARSTWPKVSVLYILQVRSRIARDTTTYFISTDEKCPGYRSPLHSM